MGAEKPSLHNTTTKKNPVKVPKRIHKAEREKMKREHLNELFLELAGALELTEQNSGKASILCETTRVVKEMVDQIKSLKKENSSLLSESQYVMVERNELEDETCGLQKQISELKNIIKERTIHVQKNLDLNAPAIETQEPPQYINPVFVIPACHTRMEVGVVNDNNAPVSNVSKPYPRYPTPSDSWPLQLLEKASRV